MPNEGPYPDAMIVPPPPSGTLWDDNLRWCIFVMNKADPQRHFAASCLAWVLKSGGLSEKQSKACEKMLARISSAYEDGALDCQSCEEMSDLSAKISRRGMH
jgi:hypothetical protein